MKTFSVGLIRVVTMDDPEMVNLHGKLLEQRYPMLRVTSRCLSDQPEGVHDDETEALAIPKVLALGRQMQQDGMQAVIVSCAGDPGVSLLRKELSIPVIGAGESVACCALRYGEKVGALGITDAAPDAYRRILAGRIVDATRPEGVYTTLDLMNESGRQSVIARARTQKALGAEVIALCCTGMSTIGIAAALEREVGIPVLDPVVCEGAFTLFELARAELLV